MIAIDENIKLEDNLYSKLNDCIAKALTRRSPTAEASIINVLNIETNKPRTQRNIFICISMKYVSTQENIIY